MSAVDTEHTNADVIDVRTQLVKTVQVLAKPSKLLIALFARNQMQAHIDLIDELKTDEALLEKQIVEAFTELLALDGRPVAVGRENTPNLFDFIEGEARLIEAEITQGKDAS